MSKTTPHYGSVEDIIGNTPLVRLRGPSAATGCEILGKCEFMNPGGAIKDRTAVHMINQAEKSGALKPGVSRISMRVSEGRGTRISTRRTCAASSLHSTFTPASRWPS